MQAFDDVLDSGGLPNPLEDARLLAAYAAAGGNVEELIYLSLGETWSDPPPGLLAALCHVPIHAQGYTLSPYGLPALRRVLRDYVIRTHELTTGEFDVAVSQSGTRAAMSDFAHLVLARLPGPHTALVPAPGWDYTGVLAPLGFTVRSYDLSRERGWQPDPEAVRHLLDSDRGSALLVLNPQHNPTGTDWSTPVVESLVRTAFARHAAILLDDAYFAVHTPGTPPTNALRVLVSETTARTPPWLAVRTLGKQFRCNGWGIGALTAHPHTLVELATITQRRSYGTALPLQAAMASWLTNPESDDYVDRLRRHYARARQHVRKLLVENLGFPDHEVHPGTCTSYLRFRIPPRFAADGDEDRYRRLCLAAGTLPGRGSMADDPGSSRARRAAYVRVHLGQSTDVLTRALHRLEGAGLGWC